MMQEGKKRNGFLKNINKKTTENKVSKYQSDILCDGFDHVSIHVNLKS